MSLNAAEQFRQSVNADPALQQAVRQCLTSEGTIDLSAVAALGNRRGHDFSAEDAGRIFADEDCELSEFELELVSAGAEQPCNYNSGHV